MASARKTSVQPLSYGYVYPPGEDPLFQQKRGIATTVLHASFREERPDDLRLPRILCPIPGPKSPAVDDGGSIHLTTIGWRRVRAAVKKALLRAIETGDAPATLRSFEQYEACITPLLEMTDRLALGLRYEDDLGIEFPYLVLAPGAGFDHESARLRRHELVSVNHQGGGYSCTQRTFRGIVLTPNAAARTLAKHLDAQFHSSSFTPFAPWSILALYQRLLGRHGLSCQRDYAEFEESVYPIDAEHAHRLTDLTLPSNLQHLIKKQPEEGGRPKGRGRKALPRWKPSVAWHLYLVTSNSD